MAAGADGAQRAGDRHHAARPAADRRQPRRREREPPAVRDHRLHSGLRRRAAGLRSDLRSFRPARAPARRAWRSTSPPPSPPPSRRASRSCSRLRFIQGIGAAATRVIAVSFIRDVFGGRRMAEVMSLVFMVFMVIPVVAPGVGQLIMLFSEWHMIFIFMAVVAAAISHLDGAPAARNHAPREPPAADGRLRSSTASASCSRRASRCSTRWRRRWCSARCSASSIRRSRSMSASTGWASGSRCCSPAIAGMMAVSSFVNSQLVGRFGMRRLSHGALIGFLAVNTIWLILALQRPDPDLRLRAAVRGGDAAIRLDRIELQLDRHGAARPRRRHGLVDPRLHADAGRRRHRRRASASCSTAR